MMRMRYDDLVVEVAPGRRALDGVSGEIAAGSITAVIGPSGAGKSTLLGVLSGLVRPDRGRLRFDDVDVTAAPPERRGLGVVFQELRLFDFLSARDNVGFGPRVANLSRAEQRRRVDEALELVRATAFADRPARVLSGGERQRIAIARALATRPRGLLLDEPFGALDAELRRGLRDELSALIRRVGVTTVLVTHDRDDAFALATHVIVLRDGRVEQEGEVATLYAEPVSAFVATLLGEATLLPVERRDGERAFIGGRAVTVRGDGARAVVRPEQLRLAEAGWRGRVLDARFAAGRWRLVVELPGLPPLVALVDRPPDGEAVALAPAGPLHTVP